jgi:alpha-tubulin suppressor-like RCC1 family protein
VACVGLNWLGELGDGVFSDSLSPVAVVISDDTRPKLSDIAQVTANGTHSCARFASTWLVACWGNNSQGQLAHPDVTYYTASPVGVALRVRNIDAGFDNTCAMLDDFSVDCWGDNRYGQLGNGTTTGSRVPIALALPKISDLSTGNYFSCAVIADGTVKCWGQGSSGQLGNDAAADSATPVAVVQG